MTSRSTRKQDPVALVLGPTGPGPFALLDLPAADVGMPQVMAALHLRLEQVRASPHAATPAAEDVRLALHAAAAQLCDPAVRRLLLGTWATGASTGSSVSHDGDDARLLLERDLHIAVGLSGGWNASAMQRLAIACEARGLSLAQLGEVLDGVARRPPVPHGASVRGGRASPSGTHRTVASVEPLPRDVLVAIGGGATLVVCIVVGLLLYLGSHSGSAAKQDVVAALGGGATSGPLKLEGQRPPTPAEAATDLSVGDARSIDREIASLTKALNSEDAAEASANIEARFATAFEVFSTNWHLLRREEITAVVSSLIDLSFAAAQKQREREIIVAIDRVLRKPPLGRREVRSVAAAGSVAARLLQERDLPRAMREELEAALRANAATSGLGARARFEVAAEQIVTPLAEAIAVGSSWADVGSWKGFLDVRDAALGDRTRAKDAATIAALRGVLRSNLTENPDEAITLLAGSMSWERTAELRAAMKSWFDDPMVPTSRLAALTRAMIKSPLRGVDSTMVLPATASREDRQTLGASVDAVLRDEQNLVSADAIRAWVSAVDQILEKRTSTASEAIDLAASMAELIVVRVAQLEGRSDDLNGRLPAALVASTLPPVASLRERPSALASSRALEYAAIGPSQAARVEFWKKRLADTGSPDVLLARAALEEAARGSPAAVREAARDFVRARSADVSMLVAAIDLVFVIPESRENLEWLSDIVGRRINWAGRGASREAAHRALLEAAAERFPPTEHVAAIDVAAIRLSRAWLLRLGEVVQDDSVNAGDAIRRVALSMLAGGHQGDEGDVRRRLDARLTIARGSMQSAVWWQAAVVEMIAIDAAKRSPRVDVRSVMELWEVRRRRASTVFEQLLEGERAVLSILRLEVPPVTGEGT